MLQVREDPVAFRPGLPERVSTVRRAKPQRSQATARPTGGRPCLRVLRRAARKVAQKLQHQQRRADGGQRCDLARGTISKRAVDHDLRQAAARKRQPAKPDRNDASGHKHGPQMTAAGRGDHAHGQEQCAFDQDVVGGIEGDGQCRAAVPCGSSVNSLPITSGSPASFAARCARTTPATKHSSVMASAAYPSACARSTSSSGCEAPRRNEKLDRQCSSA